MPSLIIKVFLFVISLILSYPVYSEESQYLRLMEKEKEYKQLLKRADSRCSRFWAGLREHLFGDKPLPSADACRDALQSVQKHMAEIDSDYKPSTGIEFETGVRTGNFAYYPLVLTKVKEQFSKDAEATYNRDPRFRMDTEVWEKTPIKLSGPKTVHVEISDNEKCYLAGDKLGNKSWNIDNFLFFELTASKQKDKYFAVGVVLDKIFFSAPGRGEVEIKDVVKTGKNIGSTEVELSQYFPKNKRFSLTVTALDYGGITVLSNVYLVCK